MAGRRLGLAGGRSGLFYEFARLIEEAAPTWVLIENVPGLLSSHKGRDMGAVLGTLAELGYGYAYRVLDASYFGVPQKRRRVFIVGNNREWTRPGEVLLEPHCVPRDPAEGEEPEAQLAPDPETRLASGGVVAFDWQASAGHGDESWSGAPRSWIVKQGDYTGSLSSTKVQAIAHSVRASSGSRGTDDPDRQTFLPIAKCLSSRQERYDYDTQDFVTVGSFRKSRKAPKDSGLDTWVDDDKTGTLNTFENGSETRATQLVVFHAGKDFVVNEDGVAFPVTGSNGQPGSIAYGTKLTELAVRRLTPLECERLQGFPDFFTAYDADGKEITDSARYRVLGNAVAVPCSYWLGRRLLRSHRRMEGGLSIRPIDGLPKAKKRRRRKF